jgi:formamidopyrimidine-DNA glycosylase
MPELPEAETIARGLHAAVAGRRVERVRVHRHEVVEPMAPAAFRRALRGRRLQRVGRRGKWIVAELDQGPRWVTQLRMTGKFTWERSSSLSDAPHLSLSVLVDGPDGAGVIRFYDTRRFGRSWILSVGEWSEIDRRLGVEPLSHGFTAAALRAILSGSRAPVRNLLLDQRRIAGIGNIYATEACWLAAVDPRRPSRELHDTEVERLRRAIRTVLRRAVRRRGTSFSDYRDVLGASGGFQSQLEVYGREGEICARCGGRIHRTVLAGRSTFFCCGCQA